MKKNIGSLDRILRIVAAVIVGLLYATNQISGTGALLLGLVAGILLITSFVSVCPLYIPLRLSTLRKNQE